MADSILNKTLLNIYKGLIKINDDTNGIDGSDENIVDGNGTASTFYLSTTKTKVKPASNNTESFSVKNAADESVLLVDTTNKVVKTGDSQYYVGSGVYYFGGSNIDPTGAGYHMAIPTASGGNYLGAATDELDFGNGSDPATSLDISGLTEDTASIHYYQYIPYNISIDKVECFFGSESGTPTCNFHLYSYTLDKSNGGGSGDLSSGTLIASTGTQATSATAINYLNATISSASVTAEKVLVATIESDADVLLHTNVCVKYHLV